MSKLKVGVIGAGGIAHAHLPFLAKRSDAVELTAIADINPEAAAAVAEQYGITEHGTSTAAVIAAVDAVLVCIPTHLHAPVAIDALKAGKAVFCEKPIARSLDDAKAIVTASHDSRAPLQVGFVRRFDEEWLAFREAILADKVGRPVVWRNAMAGPGPANPWFNTESQGGGPFLDGCIHNLDFALHTFGPASWVFAHLRTLSPKHTALDTGTATIHFASGDELMLAWSWGLPAGCSGDGIFDILGPDGTMTWPNDPAEKEYRHFVINNGPENEDVRKPSGALNDAFRLQMDEFIAVASGRANPRAGGSEGLESLKLALAILDSGRSHHVVRL